MSFNTALDSGQYTKLRSGGYFGEYLVTLCANTVVFAGQINSDLATPLTWAQFNYNNVTVGAYTDVVVGQALLISKTNDITTAAFRGRIRLTPTSSIIYCNESSQDFNVLDYFWVINTFDPTYRLSRPDASDNEQIDYDLAYAPDPALAPTLRTAYVDWVDSGTGKMRVAFDVSDAYATDAGATITGYLFAFKTSSYTVISGSLSTAVVTVDFNPGEQWGMLTLTDSNGVAWPRHIYIKAIDASNPPDSGFDQVTITGNLQQGWTAQVTAFTGVNSVYNDTFAVIWRHNENYGGSAGGLVSGNNIAFVGWVQSENDTLQPDDTYSVLADAQFAITGALPRMSRLAAQLLVFFYNNSPSAWGQIANLTPWRGMVHFLAYYTTFLNLCGLDFFSTDTTYLFPEITTQGGNIQSVIAGIAGQINCILESAPDGRLEINRDAAFLGVIDRDNLTVVANYQAQDCLTVSRAIDPEPNYGVVDADGAVYTASNGQVTPYTVRAPGHAQGQAQGRSTLSSQILTTAGTVTDALNDLRLRTGNELNRLNMSETLTVQHFDGLTVLVPSRYQLFTFTLDASVSGGSNVARIIYDTNTLWLLESVTYTLQPDGGMVVSGTYRRLPEIGDFGDDTTLIAQNEVLPAITDPGLPAFNFELPEFTFPDTAIDPTVTPVAPSVLLPPPGQVAALTGQELVAYAGQHAYWLRNFITLKKPTAREVTPSDLAAFTIEDVAVDPFFSSTAVPCYLLGSDGTNSAIWYTPNVAAVVPSWTKQGSETGVYGFLRATSVKGTLGLYSRQGSGGSTTTYDFTSSNGGWSAVTVDVGTFANYLSSTGWSYGDIQQPTGTYYRGVGIQKTISSTTLTSIRVTYDVTMGEIAPSYGPTDCFLIIINGVVQRAVTFDEQVSGTNKVTEWVGSIASVTSVEVQNVASAGGGLAPSPAGSALIKEIILTNGTGADATVVFSADYGVTYGTVRTIGATPGNAGGFDTQRSGAVSYATCAAKTRKATTLGGAYSDFAAFTGANPVCCILPYYRRNSSTKITAVSDPDVIVALDTADSDGGTLYWVNGTTAVKTDITPVAGMTFDAGQCLDVRYGKDIAAFGKVSGVYKLYYSIDAGGTWHFVKNLSAPSVLVTRRNDNRPAGSPARGQLYLADSGALYYSSYWASNGVFVRTMPTSIVGMDTVF